MPPDLAGAVGCPRCQFVFSPRAPFMTLDYCPRCLARRHVAQPLERIAPEIGFELVAGPTGLGPSERTPNNSGAGGRVAREIHSGRPGGGRPGWR